MSWKKGPMPKETWGWGGVVPFEIKNSKGFYFADFHGDFVIANPGTPESKRLEAHEIVRYNNCLQLPNE